MTKRLAWIIILAPLPRTFGEDCCLHSLHVQNAENVHTGHSQVYSPEKTQESINLRCNGLRGAELSWSAFQVSSVKPKPEPIKRKEKKIPLIANANFKQKQPNCQKCGKTRATSSRLMLALNLIGWESGTCFLDQSRNEIKKTQNNSRLISTLDWKWLHMQVKLSLKPHATTHAWTHSILLGSPTVC